MLTKIGDILELKLEGDKVYLTERATGEVLAALPVAISEDIDFRKKATYHKWMDFAHPTILLVQLELQDDGEESIFLTNAYDMPPGPRKEFLDTIPLRQRSLLLDYWKRRGKVLL